MTLFGHLKTLHCIFEIWHQRIQKFIKSQLKADLIWPELLYLQSKIKEKKKIKHQYSQSLVLQRDFIYEVQNLIFTYHELAFD